MDGATETESLSRGIARPPSTTTETVRTNDHQSQPASVQSGYGTIETPYIPPNRNWWQDFRGYKAQSNSLTAASPIFLSSGMSLSLSIGFGTLSEYGSHEQYCFFIAIIIGATISAFLADKLTKCAFYLCASLLVIVKGLIYTFIGGNMTWVVAARYCDGIAFGLIIIPTVLAGSEVSSKMFRGRVLGVEQSSLVTGAMISSLLIAPSLQNNVDGNRICGIASLFYGLIALIYTYYFTIESPIFHLRKNNETEALQVLRRLQATFTVTDETNEILNENKALLEEDQNRGMTENTSISLLPLMKIASLRTIVSLSFSLTLTFGYLFSSQLVNYDKDPNGFLFMFMRLLGVVCSILTIDTVGKRTISTLALLIGSFFLLGIGFIFSPDATERKLNFVIAFFLIHQFFSGVVAPTSTCYLGEAFPLSLKPYCILISIIVENLAQIIICAKTTVDSTANYAYFLAGVQFLYALVFYMTVPETKKTTLREALDKFKRTTAYTNLGNA